jgi:hypothetical protein
MIGELPCILRNAARIDPVSDLGLWLVPICALGLLVGIAIGQWEKLKEKWAGKRPSDAAMVKDFTPRRFVQWLQDELAHFRMEREAEANKENRPKPERSTLHDFRRTTISDLQMAGVPEKETSLMVGATPEVIRKHYEKLEAMTIAKRCVLRRLQADGSGKTADPNAPIFARSLRAGGEKALDNQECVSQTVIG